ncbi:CAP domain-containing protein [Proteiniclasticum sp. C24MP]|uniref:CAP domain-containing protein n=1 Tax=Proteiniclasticum sp. C24MP TaxID=3374101 RepID=UPI0037548BA8
MMKKSKRYPLLLILLLTGVLLTGCGKDLEEQMNVVEESINRFEEKANEFFDTLGDSLDEVIENVTEYIENLLQEEPADEIEEPEDVQSEGLAHEALDMDYVSRSMEEAFREIPYRYDYAFDVESEDYILERLNTYREEYDLHPLERREDLSQSARYKSLAMLQYDYFSHDNPNLGNRPFDYLLWRKLDLKYSGIGENLAFVSNSAFSTSIHAEELFTGWQNSDGHNKQMLSPIHKYIGIGVVRATESGSYFKGYKVLLGTQHFGN